jgi:flagellar hook-associated protein 2
MSTSSSSATTASSVQYGNNVAPISFPGIASGIDYNSIISKYVDITLEQSAPLQTKVTALNSQQTELLKIQNLLTKFQDTFENVSDPANFSSTKASSSNTTAVTAASIAGGSATPGTYVINSATLATATSISNSPSANGTFSDTATLDLSGSSVTPTNGDSSTGLGQITIDGVAISYNVTSDTLQSIIARINSNATLQTDGVTASDTGGVFSLVSTNAPLTIGAASDSGNLATVLKIDTAPIIQSGGTYSVTGSSVIGGINEGATFNTDSNAGFATAVTSGNFSINGVVFSVNASGDNLADLIQKINQSSAGVTASYDQSTGKIALTSNLAGPQGIVLGSGSDTSNFLQAAGFLNSATTPGVLKSGATETVGKAAVINFTDASGNTNTVYSNSNAVTNVVPGTTLTLTQAIGGSSVVAPVTVTVAADTSSLTSAITSWLTAYNNVISEIDSATAAPTYGSSTSSTTGQSSTAALTSGGILFNNQDVLLLKDQLVNVVSGFGATGSTSYNSLASVGLQLTSQFSVETAQDSTTNSQDTTGLTTTSQAGTDGQFQPLDTTTFLAALAANGNAVQQLFTGTSSIIGQVGAILTNATGLPTQLKGGLDGTVPTQSLFSTIEEGNTNIISSLQEQIQTVTDQANAQADRLRAQFTASEGQIAQLQSEQSSLSSLLANS